MVVLRQSFFVFTLSSNNITPSHHFKLSVLSFLLARNHGDRLPDRIFVQGYCRDRIFPSLSFYTPKIGRAKEVLFGRLPSKADVTAL